MYYPSSIIRRMSSKNCVGGESAFQEGWATSLLSAYYPLLLSGSSLIVCFWAENTYRHEFQRLLEVKGSGSKQE
uniref:SFRICE_037564 n=1 Tax=Spodoptera frugiperda TaxID=7108 RepID=A0A2H1W6B5_SPOFR